MKTTHLTLPVMGWMAMFTSCSVVSNNYKAEESFTPSKLSYQSAVVRTSAVPKPAVTRPAVPNSRLKTWASEARIYAQSKGFNSSYCFLLDMSVPSGQNRFFVYDFVNNYVVLSGLVAHGTCNEAFIKEAKFSNMPGTGCSSMGKYKVGNIYYGQYGKSYRLHGLEGTNSNAFKRAVVLHGCSFVPDQEISPKPLCNSMGCPMVSKKFFTKLSAIIDRSTKPILLWVYK